MSGNSFVTYCYLCQTDLLIDDFLRGQLNHCPRCKNIIHLPTKSGETARLPEFALRTARLSIDLASKKHWKGIHTIESDPENFHFEITPTSTAKETKTKIKHYSYPEGLKKYYTLLYHISCLEHGNTIGIFTVSFLFPYYSAKIGFMLHHPYQNLGYGTEALVTICDHFINTFHVEKISAMCDPNNTACKRILQKAGFIHEFTVAKYYHRPNQGWVNAPTYTLYREAPVDNMAEPEPDTAST